MEAAAVVSASDAEFDAAIAKLDIGGLISLVSCLQNEMATEQRRFDQLSQYLESEKSREEQQASSAALCASQARLAQLCARNMKCFTQQARRAQQDHVTVVGSRSASANDSEAVRIRKNGFRDNLLFFELQAKMNCKNGPEADGLKPSLRCNGLSLSSPDLLDDDDDPSNKGYYGSSSTLPRNRLSSSRSAEDASVYERLSRVNSLGDGLKRSEVSQHHQLRPAPSVEEILQSVKDLRMRQTQPESMDTNQNGGASRDSPGALAWRSERNQEEAERRLYANVAAPHEPFYENVCGVYSNDDEEPIYENIREEPLYDVPRKWPGGPRPVQAAAAAATKNTIVPAASELILQQSMAPPPPRLHKTEPVDSDTLSDCDKDSLEESCTISDCRPAPDIPSPDYGSDEDDAVYGGEDDAAYGVYEYNSSCSDYSDSGLGESDGRSTYYLEDQGLEVIVEEEEEDLEEDDYSCLSSDKLSSLDYLSTTTSRSAYSSNGYAQHRDEDDVCTAPPGFYSGDLLPDGTILRRGSAVSCPDKFDLPDSAVDLDELSGSERGVTSPDSTVTSDGSLLITTSTENDDYPLILVTPPEAVENETPVNLPIDPSQSLESNDTGEETASADETDHHLSEMSTENVSDNHSNTSREVNGHHKENGIKSERYKNGNDTVDLRHSEPTSAIGEETPAVSGEEEVMDVRHLLPSVKALRSQFETKNENGVNSNTLPRSNVSFSRVNPRNRTMDKPRSMAKPAETVDPTEYGRSHSIVSQSDHSIPELLHSLAKIKDMPANQTSKLSKSKTFDVSRGSMNGTVRTAKPIFSPEPPVSPDDIIPSIIAQFGNAVTEIDDMSRQKVSTYHWDPTQLLLELYQIQSPQPTYASDARSSFINIEGYLDKLPSGRKKATFWNAWKRRFFRLRDGYLYYYQNHNAEKPSLTLNLMGGHIDSMETTMLGVDDGKGHYVVVRCNSKQETDHWKAAFQTHTAENFNLTYTQPVPAYPHFYEDVVIIDLGSCSVRAGILCNQPTLPQLFLPTVCYQNRASGKYVFGIDGLNPENRGTAPISFPLRPSAKVTKYSVDLEAVGAILEKVFSDLNIDPNKFQIQLSLPRSFTVRTQTEVLRLLFDQFHVRSVNLTTQTVLSLLSYNATSGIVVDIGERLDVIPIIDGYVVEPGVSRINYGGARIAEHLCHFLLQRHYSMVSDMESYLVRYVMEQMCYSAEKYNEELQTFYSDPDSFEKTIPIHQFFQDEAPWDDITLDNGRFQAPEGLFNPDAWGLDNPGVHKLVHKAIQECSLDIRKEMTRSIYLSGGLTLLPGFGTRLELEVDKLTPPSLIPKVHSSPYRYHAAYLGACILAGSPGFQEAKITQEDWVQSGVTCLRKWHL